MARSRRPSPDESSSSRFGTGRLRGGGTAQRASSGDRASGAADATPIAADRPGLADLNDVRVSGARINAALFTDFAALRAEVRAPLVLFTYANPVVRMGLPAFARRARAAGIDGVLVLDLPPEEAGEARAAFMAEGLDTIFLLSPTTTDARIGRAAALGRGFLYGISRLGVTGARDRVASGAEQLVSRIRAQTDLPIALGFGISTPDHVAEVGAYADAAVVGSALVALIAEASGSADLLTRVDAYVRSLRQACATARARKSDTSAAAAGFEACRMNTHSAWRAANARPRSEEPAWNRTGVRCGDGSTVPADLVVVGIGIIANDDLAKAAGLTCDRGIVVDAHLRTADPDICAIGDCAAFPHPMAQGLVRLESVQNAIDQGKTVADAIMGDAKPYAAVPWFWSDQYEVKLQIVGLTSQYDDTVTLGDVESGRFSVLYFRSGGLIGIDSVNMPSDHVVGRKLFNAGKSVTIDTARAPDFSLRATTSISSTCAARRALSVTFAPRPRRTSSCPSSGSPSRRGRGSGLRGRGADLARLDDHRRGSTPPLVGRPRGTGPEAADLRVEPEPLRGGCGHRLRPSRQPVLAGRAGRGPGQPRPGPDTSP